jgi:uncharacterized protein (DUF427 family)
MTALRIEPNPKWIRGKIGDRTVVDSKAVQLVWEHQYYPFWYIPVEDVADATLPSSEIDELPGHVKVDWNSVDTWLEEDVEVIIHPRDPYRRVDVLPSSRHVVVRIEGLVVADSHSPTLLLETGLPTRYYLPVADVETDLLTPTDTSSGCPYKGIARYWNVTVDGVEHTDVVWGYDNPLPESTLVEGLMCFYNEKVELQIDGVIVDQPVTKFS